MEFLMVWAFICGLGAICGLYDCHKNIDIKTGFNLVSNILLITSCFIFLFAICNIDLVSNNNSEIIRNFSEYIKHEKCNLFPVGFELKKLTKPLIGKTTLSTSWQDDTKRHDVKFSYKYDKGGCWFAYKNTVDYWCAKKEVSKEQNNWLGYNIESEK